MKEQRTSILKARCPNPVCKSSWTMWRVRTETYLCRKCGNIFKREDIPQEEGGTHDGE